MPYTRITRPLPLDPLHFPVCVADCYSAGVLTVTDEDRCSIVRTFPSDQWVEAIVFAADGYALYSLRNPEAWRAIAVADIHARLAMKEQSR